MSMTLIETKTVGTAVASLEFTSIPADFTDLYFLSSSRSTRTNSTNDSMIIKLNGTEGEMRRLFGTGSSASSDSLATMTALISTNATTANTFSNDSVYIANYTASTNKSLSVDSVSENNATAATQLIAAAAWSNSAAVTSVSFAPVNGDLVVGSTISLYGITKGSDGIVTTS